MQTMGSSKGELMTADLKLSAKLAKIELPEDFLLGTPYAKKYTAEWDSSNNSPRAIKWRPFIDAIEYPKMQSKDQWKNDYEAREAKKAAAKAAADKAAAEAAAVAAAAAAPAASAARNLPYVSDDELRKAHNVIKSKLATQFGELRQSFRALDTDGSGFITHEEAIASVTTLNLGLPKRILARFVDLADYDGDGEISFAEFARVLTADDIMLMKDSVGASYKGGMADSHKKGASIPKASRVIKDGVTEDDIRMFVLQMKEKLLNKYTRLDTAFKNIDEDRSGFLNANEFKFLLKVLNLERQKPAVIDVLLGLMDDDGDGQINHQEFTCAHAAHFTCLCADALCACILR